MFLTIWGNKMAQQVKDHFNLTESEMSDAVMRHLEDSDADELSHVAEILFGGECFTNGETYEFFPNANYCDAFGKYNEPEPWREAKVRSLKELRKYIRQVASLPKCSAVRLVAFDIDENTEVLLPPVKVQVDASGIKKSYPYNSLIDLYAQDWADQKLVSIEAVVRDY